MTPGDFRDVLCGPFGASRCFCDASAKSARFGFEDGFGSKAWSSGLRAKEFRACSLGFHEGLGYPMQDPGNPHSSTLLQAWPLTLPFASSLRDAISCHNCDPGPKTKIESAG